MTLRTKRIFLIGPMGAGKTTIGSQLSRTLNFQFFDSDHEIVKNTGVEISLIFDIEGEKSFRLREKKMVDNLTKIDDAIIATGGGAILDADSRDRLQTRGFVVYLKSSTEVLARRTQNDKNRPLLKNTDRVETIETLKIERAPLYESIANITIDTGATSIKQIVKQIMRAMT